MPNLDDVREYQGLSQEYWARLTPRDRELYALIRPTPGTHYEVDVHVHRLQDWAQENHDDLERAGGGLEMTPDFQRGHVWTSEQRSGYCEALVRGQAPTLLRFNCPGYHGQLPDGAGDLPRNLMQCVDGLQRFTAITEFAAGRVEIFGGMVATDFVGTPFDIKRLRVQIRIYGLQRRADLLSFYLDLNSGGTVHSSEELARVRRLLRSVSDSSAAACNRRS